MSTAAAAPRPDFVGRHRLVLVLFALAAGALAARVLYLQLDQREFLRSEGDARRLRVVELPAHRGTILDRNGEVLAMSTPVASVWANPAKLASAGAGRDALADALGVDRERLRAVLGGGAAREFVYLRRRVSPTVAEHVRELNLPGVYLERAYRRYYPMGEVAASVVGVTDVDDSGQEGLELALDARLRGEPGARRVLRDLLGREVEDVSLLRAPRPGQDTVLTIDRRLQYLTYRALAAAVRRERARSASAVVLDVGTGEVLALANYPSFNPNNLGDRASARVRNRAVTDVFEPGSAIKPFTVAGALASGLYRASTVVDTSPGFVKVGRHTVRDSRNLGRIDVATVIKKSSNVGATRIALSVPPEAIWSVLDGVGFGKRTGSGFPGEPRGVLEHYLDWGEVRRATLSYGYGLSVTPLQLARAYAAIGAGGVLPPVSFERQRTPNAGGRVMPEGVAAALRDMLEGVTLPGGTGTRARVPGYRVGGKTGTAKKSVAGGYAADRYVAVFAGIAPMSAPRLAVVVKIDEPGTDRYYGGVVAAPVFSEVAGGALRILGIAPDGPEVQRRRLHPRSAAADASGRMEARAPGGSGSVVR